MYVHTRIYYILCIYSYANIHITTYKTDIQMFPNASNMQVFEENKTTFFVQCISSLLMTFFVVFIIYFTCCLNSRILLS